MLYRCANAHQPAPDSTRAPSLARGRPRIEMESNMKKLKVELENCYGIKKLKYEFSFENRRTFLVYSPNGVMKTSFAKSFIDISNGNDSKDLVSPEAKTKRLVVDENNKEIEAGVVFVIPPYNETYKSEKVSTLLVNAKLRNEYEAINLKIEARKESLIDALKPLFGIKSGLEELIGKVFTKIDNGFYKAITRVKDEVADSANPEFEGIIYKNIFSEKTEQFLGSQEIRIRIKDYISKYDELIAKSKYLKRGVFNHTNASIIAKNLKENGFFKASHTVNLISKDERREFKTEKEFEDALEQEKNEILSNPELVSIFDDLDKKISANKDLRDFREYLLQNISIVPELSNIEAFKEKIIIGYFKTKKELFSLLVAEYESGKKEIERIVEQARSESTQWSRVIDIFNNRFHVPFKLSVGNQDQVILNAKAPVVNFEFVEGQKRKPISEPELLAVLSTGEKRALYLLNILFEVEARKETQVETLFVIDDIADSFDYKNKYAIIEYLKDISELEMFYQIILTHNYDFFRTLSSRLDIIREHKLNTDKSDSEIIIFQEKYQSSPFLHWKKNLSKDNSMLIASIPFCRNIAEFSGDEEVFLKLTSLLHYKPDTDSITVANLQSLIQQVMKDMAGLVLPSDSEIVIDRIFEVANQISKGSEDKLDLEKKICLSIGARLKSEKFMVKKINDHNFWQSISKFQSHVLLEKFKATFPSEYNTIELLEQVNLMTPENIHINSFMYEPILDMSNHHLKKLYSNVLTLN